MQIFSEGNGPKWGTIDSKKLIKSSISVREGVWKLIFEFEGTSGEPCRELIFEFKSPL